MLFPNCDTHKSCYRICLCYCMGVFVLYYLSCLISWLVVLEMNRLNVIRRFFNGVWQNDYNLFCHSEIHTRSTDSYFKGEYDRYIDVLRILYYHKTTICLGRRTINVHQVRFSGLEFHFDSENHIYFSSYLAKFLRVLLNLKNTN